MMYNIVLGETDPAIKKQHWDIAFGLQAVDNLTPSDFARSLAAKNITGDLTGLQVRDSLKKYYAELTELSGITSLDETQEEADMVSAAISELLGMNYKFTFMPSALRSIHRHLFKDVYPAIAGAYREVNIAKSEPVLRGESVAYDDYPFIEEGLQFYFDGEGKEARYVLPLDDSHLDRLSSFITNIWRVHPFREGNTRTIAVFMQIYMATFGKECDNSYFKDHSEYFREALVRAAYDDKIRGIEADPRFLNRFLGNLYAEQQNSLNSETLYLDSSEGH